MLLAKAFQPATATAQAPLSSKTQDPPGSVSNAVRKVIGPRYIQTLTNHSYNNTWVPSKGTLG